MLQVIPKQKVATPYLKMVLKTLSEVLQLTRPLTIDKIVDYVELWYKNKLTKRRFITRAAYNKLLQRKINATIRALKTVGNNVDVLMETSIRNKISARVNNIQI